MAEENFSSNHGLIMLALRDLVKSLQPDNLSGEEVQIRSSWLYDGQPLRGVTIYELGEQYHEGAIGTQDIGYVCGIVFVDGFEGDARMSSDQSIAWRELIRRRLTDQRLNVTIDGDTDPSEHVCIVNRSGESLSNPSKYPLYNISRLVVTVWLREVNPETP